MSPDELARLNNIPNELKELNQWCLWKDNKVPYQPNGQKASVTDARTYSSYSECLSVIDQYKGLGFIFTVNDPYCFLDLDNCGNSQQAIDIYNEFNSYSEISQSSKGVHIICKASIPQGRRKNGIEIYSSVRYATMTGNIWCAHNILDCQDKVERVYASLGEDKKPINGVHVDYEQITSDEQVIELARNAIDGEKFQTLWEGRWQELYPEVVARGEGPSVADQALMNMIWFYSKNEEQTLRIINKSELRRDKFHTHKTYLSRTLKKAKDRDLPEVEFVNNSAAIDKIIASIAQSVEPSPHKTLVAGSSPAAGTIKPPPGFVGEFTDYIFNTSPTPVFEVAYASAITAMAGLTGRAYNVLGNGLNLYVVLIAKSGIGKEWAKGGIERLIRELKQYTKSKSVLIPFDLDSFIGPRRFASLTALSETFEKQKSFVSIQDEFGLKLKGMLDTDNRAHAYQNELCAGLLEVYGTSGVNGVFRPAVHARSSANKNSEPVNSPAISILGLTTPETFYSIVNEESIAQGFLPRFMIIEYDGLAVPLNENRDRFASPQLLGALEGLIVNCKQINANIDMGGVPCDIGFNDQAKKISSEFYEYARNNQNKLDSAALKQLWSRAHMKALKTAGLYSINPLNYHNPVIVSEYLYAAIDRVIFDVDTLSSKFEKDEVGSPSNENKQYKDMIKNILEYVHQPWEKHKSYCKDIAKLHPDKVISYEFFFKRTGELISMKKDKMGKKFALDRTIKMLIDNGKLIEIADKRKYGLVSKKIYLINKQLFE